MKNIYIHSYVLVIIASVVSIGGCGQKQIKTPSYWEHTKEVTAEYAGAAAGYAATGAVVTADIADATLEYLQRGERYLQEKIEEWKVSHPEWVELAENKLQKLREKIEAHKNNLLTSARAK